MTGFFPGFSFPFRLRTNEILESLPKATTDQHEQQLRGKVPLGLDARSCYHRLACIALDQPIAE